MWFPSKLVQGCPGGCSSCTSALPPHAVPLPKGLWAGAEWGAQHPAPPPASSLPRLLPCFRGAGGYGCILGWLHWLWADVLLWEKRGVCLGRFASNNVHPWQSVGWWLEHRTGLESPRCHSHQLVTLSLPVAGSPDLGDTSGSAANLTGTLWVSMSWLCEDRGSGDVMGHNSVGQKPTKLQAHPV